MGETESLVVGLDGGGTSTRCVIATLNGEIVARGLSGGANPRSARDPGGNITRAVAEALGGLGGDFRPDRVAGGVFGLAGASEAGRRLGHTLAADAWRTARLPGLPVVVPDILVAFAGATPAPSGSVLVAGTGAIAARIENREIVRRCDGYGWLLGDEGSGVWIGRRAVQAALAALDGRGSPTVLVGRVLTTLTGSASGHAAGETRATPQGSTPGRKGPVAPGGQESESLAQAIVAAVYDGEPARLGTLSPVVEAAARAGDRVALTIMDDAARLLVRTLDAVAPPFAQGGGSASQEIATDGTGSPGSPVVLAGSLLTRRTLVAERVREALPGRPVVLARDGAAGAAALALRAIAAGASRPARPGGDPATRAAEAEAAHRRLLTA